MTAIASFILRLFGRPLPCPRCRAPGRSLATYDGFLPEGATPPRTENPDAYGTLMWCRACQFGDNSDPARMIRLTERARGEEGRRGAVKRWNEEARR